MLVNPLYNSLNKSSGSHLDQIYTCTCVLGTRMIATLHVACTWMVAAINGKKQQGGFFDIGRWFADARSSLMESGKIISGVNMQTRNFNFQKKYGMLFVHAWAHPRLGGEHQRWQNRKVLCRWTDESNENISASFGAHLRTLIARISSSIPAIEMLALSCPERCTLPAHHQWSKSNFLSTPLQSLDACESVLLGIKVWQGI